MTQRIEKLIRLMTAAELDAVVLNPGATMRYLSGLEFHLMERPVVLLVTKDGDARMILPILEEAKLDSSKVAAKTSLFGDDPSSWQGVFNQALADLSGKRLRVGVESGRLRYLEYAFLKNALPEAQFSDAGSVFAGLRMSKDAEELNRMRKAAQIAEKALISTLKLIQPGQSEKEIASELLVQLYRHGSDQELPFAPIVSSGPNSANPHASPSDRRVGRGELLLFDWGAGFEGYFSDITRCFYVGEDDGSMQTIAATVQRANHYAVSQVKPGMTAGDVDAIARQEIRESGFGEYFTHRTGHGLGMETHEAPYIFDGNPLVLEPGMVFTVEPGIYVPGLGGVRIEDDVAVTTEGFISLSTLPREVLSIERYLANLDTMRLWYETGL